MSKIRIVYLYLVCLISLFIAVGSFVGGVNQTAEYFFPTSYYDYSYDYMSFGGNAYPEENANYKAATLRALITCFAFSAVALPLFIYHWRRIEIERKESEVE